MANIFIRSVRGLPGQDNQIEENGLVYAQRNGTPTYLTFWMNMPELRAQYGDLFWLEMSYKGRAFPFAVMEGMLNNWTLPTYEQFCPTGDLILQHGEVVRIDLRYVNASGSIVTGEGIACPVFRDGGAINETIKKSSLMKDLRGVLGADAGVNDLSAYYLGKVYTDNGATYVPPGIALASRAQDIYFRYLHGRPNHTIFANVVDTYAEVQALFNDWGIRRYLTGFAIAAGTNMAYACTGFNPTNRQFTWGARPDIRLNELYPIGSILRSGTNRYVVQADGTLVKR